MEEEEKRKEVERVFPPLELYQILDRLCRKDGQIVRFGQLIKDHVVFLTHVGENEIRESTDPVFDLVRLRILKLLDCLIFLSLFRENIFVCFS